MTAPKWVVQFSGGIGSWGAARRYVDAHGASGGVLLFADTRIEDPDLYRFIMQAASDIGCPLVCVADGRTPWEVYRDERFLGNSRVAHCSQVLKQKPCREWVNAHCTADTKIIFGIDWAESHRLAAIRHHWRPFEVVAPLCDRPCVTKTALIEAITARGIQPPRMYAEGFAHNNCGGFCCRAGHAHFRHLYKVRRDVFLEAERQEQEVIEHIGKNVTILADRKNGTKVPLTLRAFRERV